MRAADLLRFTLLTLRRQRFRSLMLLLCVAIGVGSVVVLVALGEGARGYVLGQFSFIGKDTLVMFPEGTRTRPDRPMQFHRGAASVAIQGATRLTPVYITVDQPFLHKSQPWYRVPRRPPHICIRVGEDVDLEPYRNLPPPRASRQLNAALVEQYERELAPPRWL